MKIRSTRRSFLAGLGGAAAALALSGRGRPGFVSRAEAAGTGAPALVVIYLEGGFNALFCSANSFTNTAFGVTSSNIKDLGNGVVVDASTIGALPAAALSHLSVIGCNHGIAAHPTARNANFNETTSSSYLLKLADAMGGTSALRCVSVGSAVPYGQNNPVNGVTMQRVTDVSSALNILGGTDTLSIERGMAGKALAASKVQSGGRLASSPTGLVSLTQGYDAATSLLAQTPQTFDVAGVNTAYGLATTDTQVLSFKQQLRAAELMITAGANVVTAITPGWDSHADTTGDEVRTKMTADIIPALSTFVSRMLAATGRNVVTVLTGDFSRSLPGSDHQPNLSSIVIGNYCQVGTTGHVDAKVALPASTGGIKEHWAYLTKALKMSTEPFGANPHGLVL